MNTPRKNVILLIIVKFILHSVFVLDHARVCVKHNIFHKKSQYMIFHVLLVMMQNVWHILDHCPLYIATNIIKIYYCIIGFTMVNSNLPLTAVFTTFLPPLFDRKSRNKSNSKFTAVNGKYMVNLPQ